MKTPLVMSVLIAVCFGGWPLISRITSSASPVMVAAVVATTTAFVPMFAFFREDIAQAPPSAWIILIIAGVVNGFGMLLYGDLVSNRQWDLSTWVPLVVVLMVVVTAVGGMLFYGEPLSIKKIVGILLAAIAVWLMQ